MTHSLLILAQSGGEHLGLTLGGVVMMTLSIGLVLGLGTFCIIRLLGEKRPEAHHHAPLDIDTHDQDT